MSRARLLLLHDSPQFGGHEVMLLNPEDAPPQSRGRSALQQGPLVLTGRALMAEGLRLPVAWPSTLWMVEGRRLPSM